MPERFRFVAPERAVVGKWRGRLGTAVVDAVNCHLNSRSSDGSVRISVDTAVATTFLEEIKTTGYRFEKLRVVR